jgi:NAD(P)-dependent dehydrogenase (short-subunit alcohol dehydrogenase family)
VRWDLAGKAALVTGAGSGIGQAVALELARQGVNVAVADLDAAAAAATAKQAREAGADAVAITMDVSRSAEVTRGVTAAETAVGALDYLVNVAGIFEEAPAVQITDEQWTRMLAVHLNGTFYCCRTVAPGMTDRGGGSIVNISSLHALRGQPNAAHYAAAKAGIIGFTKTLAREVAAHGVRVNAVAPGPIDTPLWRAGSAGPALEARRRDRARVIPLGRLGEPAEVADAVLFLLSAASRYTTGQVLSVNGGELMT